MALDIHIVFFLFYDTMRSSMRLQTFRENVLPASSQFFQNADNHNTKLQAPQDSKNILRYVIYKWKLT